MESDRSSREESCLGVSNGSYGMDGLCATSFDKGISVCIRLFLLGFLAPLSSFDIAVL